jgi:hypothetical protein
MLQKLSLFRILLKKNRPPPNKTTLILVGREKHLPNNALAKLGKAALSPLALALTPFLLSGFFVAGICARLCFSPTLFSVRL